MIGIGKWEFQVNTIFFKGTARIEIKDNNGEYAFAAEIPGVNQLPEYYIDSIVEGDNSLKILGGTDALPGQKMGVFVKFDGDTCNGYVDTPFFGKIIIDNGKKVV